MSDEIYDPQKHGPLISDEVYDPRKHGELVITPQAPPGLAGTASAAVQGANRGVSDTFGVVGDLYNEYIGKKFAKAVTGREQTQGLPIGSEALRAVQNAFTTAAQKVTGIGQPGVKATYDNINDLPEHLHPTARAGEVAGSTLAMLAPFAGAARFGTAPAQVLANEAGYATAVPSARTASGGLGAMVNQAASNPAAFVSSQMPASVGAGIGAFGAELVTPGNPYTQFIGQLAGGGLGGLLGSGVQAGGNAATNSVKKFAEPFTANTDDGVRAMTARNLQPILEKAGENPADLINRLRTQPVVPGLPAGERAQSPALTGVQNLLLKDNPDLANAVNSGRQQYATNLEAATKQAFEPGTPAALTRAAENQQSIALVNLDRQIKNAETLAVQASNDVQPLPPPAREALNVRARNILEGAVESARKTERQIWGRVNKNIDTAADNTSGTYAAIKNEMLDGQSLPGEGIETTLKKISKAQDLKSQLAAAQAELESAARSGNLAREAELRYTVLPALEKQAADSVYTPTSGELIRLRSELLGQERMLRSNKDYNMARRMRDLSNSVLDDLAGIQDEAVQSARQYSARLNDRLTRTYAGDVLGTKETGAPMVRPALTLEAAASGSPELAAQKLKELQTAAVPIRATAEEAPTMMNAARDMRQTQEEFLRALSDKVIDPTTAAVKPAAVDKFLLDQAAVLDQFPQYRQSLIIARDRQRAYEDILSRTGDVQKQIRDSSVWAKLINAGEDPATAIGSILKGNNPTKDFGRVAKVATQGGEDAVGGLRASVLQHAVDSATGPNGLSYGKLAATLNSPLAPNQPSLLQAMRSENVISASQHAAIQRMVEAGQLNEAAKVAGVAVKDFGTGPGMWGKALSRIIGAKVANATVPGGGAGPSLQTAQIGANIGERLASRLPADKARAMMAEALAAEDPAQLIDILQRVGRTAYGNSMGGPNSDITKLIVMLRATIPHSQSEPKRADAVMEQTIRRRPGVYGGQQTIPQTEGLTIDMTR